MTNQPGQPKNSATERMRFALSGYQRAKEVGADQAAAEFQQREYGLNYTPSYWQNPRRVARYKHVIDSVPEGGGLPDWVDRDGVNAAYEFMKARHNNAPWWEWNYLPNDDKGLEPLRNIAAPPDDFLWPNEQRFRRPAQAEVTPDTEQTGISPEEIPEDLPLWQKVALSIFSSPKASGGATGAIMGGLEGGLIGALTGGALGGALGGLAQRYPALADALMVLDYPAELLERSLGSLSIGWGGVLNTIAAGGSFTDASYAAADFVNNLPAAWKAARATYEVTPVGFGGQQVLPNLGTAQYVTPEEIGLEALFETYERIKAGEDADDVYEDMVARMGFSGIARDMIGHIFADPLNWGPGLIVQGVVAPLAHLSGNDALRIAAQSSKGLTDTASMYGKLLSNTVPTSEIAKMDAVSKWLGGITQAGENKQLLKSTPGKFNRLAGALAGGTPGGLIGLGLGGPAGGVLGAMAGAGYGAKLGWSYLGSLTPAARAAELVNNSALNLNLVLNRAGGSPDEMVRFIHALANTPHNLARELSMRMIDAPEGAALQPALRDYTNVADNMLATWHATQWQRTTLENIAAVTGKTVDDVLVDLNKATDAKIILQQYVDAARASGNDAALEIVRAFDAKELTPQKLQEIGKVFVQDGLPHNEEVFQAQMYASSIEHMAKWAADWHDVKPDPAFIRMGHTIKAAQSLVLLGLNPTYFVNNAINNIVTMAATGVFGLRSQKNIDAIWTRVGVVPERLRAGIGASGVGDAIDLSPIREAGTAPGILSKVDDIVGKVNKKVGVFSNWSTDVEKWSSAQAFTSGFMQAWSRLWKPGTGFDRMPTQLEAALNNIDPGLSGLVYDAIKGGLNQGEVEAKLWSGVTRRSVDAFIPEVAARYGLNETDAAEMLRTSGVYDFLYDRLQGDPSDAQVKKAFSDLYEHVQKDFDEQARLELENEAGKVAEIVKGEGFQAALDIYDKVELEEATRHLQGFDNWEAAFAEAENMTPGQRGAYYREVKARETAEWNRFWENKAAKYQGISDALGIDTVASKSFVDLIRKNANNYKEFYKKKWELYDKHFGTQYKTPAERRAAWNGVQDDIEKAFEVAGSREIQIQTQMDDIFVSLFEAQFGPGSSAGAAEWRKGSRAVREEMIREIKAFQNSIRELGADDRRAAWSQFLNDDYKKLIVERMKANVEGVRKLVGGGGEAPRAPETQAAKAANITRETLPGEVIEAWENNQYAKETLVRAKAARKENPRSPDTASQLDFAEKHAKASGFKLTETIKKSGLRREDVAAALLPEEAIATTTAQPRPIRKDVALTTEQRASTVRTIALRFGIATAKADGSPSKGADKHILAIAKKYGGPEAKEYKTILDVDPVVARQAFERRKAVEERGVKLPDFSGPRGEAEANYVDYWLSIGAEDEAVRVLGESINQGVDPATLGISEDVANKLLGRIDEVARLDGELLPAEAIDIGATTPAVDLPLGSVEQFDTTVPVRTASEESWNETIWPMLQEIEKSMLGPNGKAGTSVKGAQLPANVENILREYLARVQGQMADTKLASIRHGEGRRDAALLNYSRRYGVDNLVGAVLPYHFWYTRSVMNWAVRSIDKPGWFANYARMREAQRNINQAPGFPTRLADKMRIPVPFLPKWAGGGIYIDPLHQIFPFEMFAQPWEQYTEQESQISRRAQYILQDWVGSEEISDTDAAQAISTQSGEIWNKALAQAKIELGDELSNPWDFISLMTSPNLPVSIGLNLLKGKKESINQLPVTRMIQSATAWATPGGINIEGGIRKAMGLPERGEFWDFYVDRQLANMAATGEITTEDATRAMVERSGPAFIEATNQVGKVQGTRFFGSALWLDFFPEGEQIQRDLQAEFSKAIDSGDSKAVSAFFEAHPEYRARMLMGNWEDPEARLKNFMVSEVWNAWRNLPDLHKREAQDQLGKLFQEAFLDKETRSYDAIDNDTLVYWSQVMGGYVPKVEGGSKVITGGLDLSDTKATESYQTYQDMRKQQFPGISDLQEFYFSLPEEQQQVFMDNNPQLQKYWNWRDTYMADNPEVISHLLSEDSKIKYASPENQQLYYQYKASKAQMFPDVGKLQDGYYDLPAGAARRAYLSKNPQLKEYWDWQREFLTTYPEMIPFVKSTESIANAMGYTQSSTGSSGGTVSYTQTTTTSKVGPRVTYANGKITFAGRVSDKDKAKLKEYGFTYAGGVWSGPDNARARSVVGGMRKDAVGAEELAKVKVAEFTPTLTRKLLGYFYSKEELGIGARRKLRVIWEQNGQPGSDFNDYLDRILKLALTED